MTDIPVRGNVTTTTAGNLFTPAYGKAYRCTHATIENRGATQTFKLVIVDGSGNDFLILWGPHQLTGGTLLDIIGEKIFEVPPVPAGYKLAGKMGVADPTGYFVALNLESRPPY